MKNNTMFMDFYELTMGQTYFNKGEKDRKVYFDVFYRANPFKGGYAISGGLDNIVDYINNFEVTESDIEYLRNLGMFKEDFLKYFKDLKFTGDIYAVPDGTPIFPNEPVITVRANIVEAQVIETALLSIFNHGTLVTTAAKRIVDAANGASVLDYKVMEFGARRGNGIESATEASKYAYIGGCVGTSNTLCGIKYGVPVMGTMAHSYISDADSEYEAFLDYAKSNPNNSVFLVDTYDTLKSGVPNAIKVAKDYLIPNGLKLKGIRIDSGDLAYLSKEARKMLDEAGLIDAKITLSNGLNEQAIRSLIDQGAKFDSIGVGDNISSALARIGGVYKLAAVEKNNEIIPRIKLSDDAFKTTNPGYKKLYRFFDKDSGFALGDVIALHNETIPTDEYTLINPIEEWKQKTINNYSVKNMMVPVYINGKQVYNIPTIKERQTYCTNEFKTIYPEIKRIVKPHEYYVDLTNDLLELKKRLIQENTNDRPKVKSKK